MLEIIKLALRVTTDAFDTELSQLIAACTEEMAGVGVLIDYEADGTTPSSMQVQTAIVAYCKWLFGNNADADRWCAIYHHKLAQLQTMSGYTNWSV